MRFEKPKGQRLYKQFNGVKVTGWWWLPEFKEWVEDPNILNGPFDEWFSDYLSKQTRQNFAPCKTVRAFKRMLRRYPWIKGKATLISRYKGCDVYA